MKSPGHSEMISPGNSDKMSPRGAMPRWLINFWHQVMGLVNPWLPACAERQRLAGKIDPIRVVDDAIQDRIVISRIANQLNAVCPRGFGW